MKKLILLLLLCSPLSANALDVSALGELPILHEGRVKPISSVARLMFGDAPVGTFALALFTPGDFLDEPLIEVKSSALRSLLELPEQARYSYNEITPKLRAERELLETIAQKEAATLTANERALYALYERIDMLTQLSGALSLFVPIELPLTSQLRGDYGIELSPPYSYFRLSRHHADMENALRELIAEKGEAPRNYSPKEQALALSAMRLSIIASTGRGNQFLRVIPAANSEEWFAPWALLNEGKGVPQMASLMQQWQAASLAYHMQDQAVWDVAMADLKRETNAFVSPALLRAEQWYHQLELINVAIALYALALLAAAFTRRQTANRLLWAAVVLHALAIMLRVVILGRPPVSTLYESVLFVALVAALQGAWLARRHGYGLPIGAALGGFLLSISGLYAGEGDAMAMPIAVLNTNFWLATHVIIITAGYGATLVAGVLGHLALWSKELLGLRALQTSALIALLLTTTGTILGGIWADQSWGRFWGWDPKENGALLIVLWLIWLLHGRMTDAMGRRGFAALLAISAVIVAISWFGVNLLGVGLHSYGFTSAAAMGLIGFCTVDLLLISALYLRARRRT